MSELTPEEKRYKEEKARIEAELNKQEKDKKFSIKKEHLILIILSVLIYTILNYMLSEESPLTDVELKAEVAYRGFYFVVKNEDDFVWKNVKIEINPNDLFGGYCYEAPEIAPNTQCTVSVLEFIRDDGDKFIPLLVNPEEVFIECETPKGRGFYRGTFK